jgi:hypothetical protein
MTLEIPGKRLKNLFDYFSKLANIVMQLFGMSNLDNPGFAKPNVWSADFD